MTLFNFRGTPQFTTDSCRHPPPWNDVRISHDWVYWRGGAHHLRTRRRADHYLFDEVYRSGYRFWAWVVWLGARAGGSQYLPFAWRWRYREPYWSVVASKEHHE